MGHQALEPMAVHSFPGASYWLAGLPGSRHHSMPWAPCVYMEVTVVPPPPRVLSMTRTKTARNSPEILAAIGGSLGNLNCMFITWT